MIQCNLDINNGCNEIIITMEDESVDFEFLYFARKTG